MFVLISSWCSRNQGWKVYQEWGRLFGDILQRTVVGQSANRDRFGGRSVWLKQRHFQRAHPLGKIASTQYIRHIVLYYVLYVAYWFKETNYSTSTSKFQHLPHYICLKTIVNKRSEAPIGFCLHQLANALTAAFDIASEWLSVVAPSLLAWGWKSSGTTKLNVFWYSPALVLNSFRASISKSSLSIPRAFATRKAEVIATRIAANASVLSCSISTEWRVPSVSSEAIDEPSCCRRRSGHNRAMDIRCFLLLSLKFTKGGGGGSLLWSRASPLATLSPTKSSHNSLKKISIAASKTLSSSQIWSTFSRLSTCFKASNVRDALERENSLCAMEADRWEDHVLWLHAHPPIFFLTARTCAGAHCLLSLALTKQRPFRSFLPLPLISVRGKTNNFHIHCLLWVRMRCFRCGGSSKHRASYCRSCTGRRRLCWLWDSLQDRTEQKIVYAEYSTVWVMVCDLEGQEHHQQRVAVP